MKKQIFIPAYVYYDKTPEYWEQKARVLEQHVVAPDGVEFLPVGELEWKAMCRRNEAQVAGWVERRGDMQGPGMQIEADEHWKVTTPAEWKAAEAEIDRMYTTGELGRRAKTYGMATHTFRPSKGTVVPSPTDTGSSGETAQASGGDVAEGNGRSTEHSPVRGARRAALRRAQRRNAEAPEPPGSRPRRKRSPA